MTIVVGTSSWSDPGFVEYWYPKGLAAKDRLDFYAERFDAVELNSSFYAIPAVSTVEGWAKRTPDGFTFDVKLHRLLSHHAAQLKELPADLRDEVETNERGRVLLDRPLLDEMVRRTAEAMQPLADAGKLGSYLLQLTPAFDPRRNELDELAPVIDGLAPTPVARGVPAAKLGLTEALRGRARLALGPRRRLRLRRHPARRPRPDLPADRRRHQRLARLHALPWAEHRGLPAWPQRRRALRLRLLEEGAGGDRRARRGARVRTPSRCT